MRIWLASVVGAALLVHHVTSTKVFGDLSARPIATALELLDAGSLYLGKSSKRRRAHLAAIETVADFAADHPVRAKAAAVGLLMTDFVDKDGNSAFYNCTASLIRPGVAITNRHCLVRDGETLSKAELWLDHLQEEGGRIVTLDKASISAHPSLDVAHLALHRDTGLLLLADLSKTVIRAARPGEQLYVLHHAKGDVLKVTRAFCRAAALQPDPVKVLYHTCATHPGSSGALIFAERDGAIVGLHYASIAKTDGYEGAAIPAHALMASK